MAKQNDNRFWFLVLCVSLLLNSYFLFYKSKNKESRVFATAGGVSFRWKDVSTHGQEAFKQLDRAYYFLMRSEAEQWAENYVLPKEAQAKGTAVDALLKSEVADKVQVSPEEIETTYAKSPSADTLPFEEAVKQIETELRSQRYQARKREYLKGLFTRYGVRFDLVVPKSFDGKEPVLPSRFPAYVPPAAGPDLDKRGNVALAPSRGPADAPVVIEVFSDFHCPYCKILSATLKELDAQYPGKIRFLFHHFPLSAVHPGTELSHQASVCAQEQGKFWEYHDRLMALTDKPDNDTLSRIAAESGLDAASFRNCFDGGKYKVWVEQEAQLGRSRGVSGAPGYFINGRFLSGAMPLDQLKKIVDWYLKPEGRYPGPVPPRPGSGQGQQAQRQGPPGLDPSKVYEFSADWLKKGPSKGPENAPVTVVEFFDYNCPFCQRGASVTDQILAAYPDKVRVIAKNLPLPMHPNSMKTAEAVLCAQEQGKFWEFRKEVFGEFWGKQSVEDMKAVAKKLGLNESGFSACLDASKMKPAVEEDAKTIMALGSTGTPTFFINGTPVVGALPFESFKKIIDEKLAAKK